MWGAIKSLYGFLRNLFIFRLARARLICFLIGHRKFINIAVFNFRRGSGRADVCPRCGELDRDTWVND